MQTSSTQIVYRLRIPLPALGKGSLKSYAQDSTFSAPRIKSGNCVCTGCLNLGTLNVPCSHNSSFCANRHTHEQLTHAVQQAILQYQGNECLLLIVNALQEEASKVIEDAQHFAVEKSKTSQEQLDLSRQPSQIGRRSIW